MSRPLVPEIATRLTPEDFASVEALTRSMSTSRADVLRRLAAQGLTTLRASTLGDPEALAVAVDEAQGPDPVVIALVDAINDRLDGLASTAPMSAARQARELSGAFGAWAALTAHGQEDEQMVLAAVLDPVCNILDHLSPAMGGPAAVGLARGVGSYLLGGADERWGSD